MLIVNISDMAQGLSDFPKISLAVAFIYILITCYFVSNWLMFLIRNPSSIPEEKFLSIVMFAITTLLWPLGTVAFFVKIVQTKKIQPSIILACLIIFLMLSVFFYFAQK